MCATRVSVYVGKHAGKMHLAVAEWLRAVLGHGPRTSTTLLEDILIKGHITQILFIQEKYILQPTLHLQCEIMKVFPHWRRLCGGVRSVCRLSSL